jgi:hypothetical protein
MAVAVQERQAPTKYMQGIAVPAESVQPQLFQRLTRRHIQIERQANYTGQPSETFELRKSDILSKVKVRAFGQIVVTPGTGTVASTARWPYDFISVRFTANGASNIINVSGAKLKMRELMKKGDLTDRGVTQTIGGVARNQGTMARASEAWGVGMATSAIGAGTYDVELEWDIPIAEDEHDLAGAIFLQTSSSDLTLTVDFLPQSQLFVTTGNATVAMNNFVVQAISTKFSIPVQGGQIVVPDLGVFHSLIQSRQANNIQAGENEFRLIGQGAGKTLLRVYGQVWNGAGTAAAPLALNRTNFGKQMWRYANNETPDEFIDGQHMRLDQEQRYNADLGGFHGVFCHDFAHENAFRDAVDMGTTAELRLVSTINSGGSAPVLASPALEYVTETVFLAGQA